MENSYKQSQLIWDQSVFDLNVNIEKIAVTHNIKYSGCKGLENGSEYFGNPIWTMLWESNVVASLLPFT